MDLDLPCRPHRLIQHRRVTRFPKRRFFQSTFPQQTITQLLWLSKKSVILPDGCCIFHSQLFWFVISGHVTLSPAQQPLPFRFGHVIEREKGEEKMRNQLMGMTTTKWGLTKGFSRYDVRIREGGWSWKRGRSKGGCINYMLQISSKCRQGGGGPKI